MAGELAKATNPMTARGRRDYREITAAEFHKIPFQDAPALHSDTQIDDVRSQQRGCLNPDGHGVKFRALNRAFHARLASQRMAWDRKS